MNRWTIWMAMMAIGAAAFAQDGNINELRKGKNYIDTPVYSEEDDQEIIRLFEPLRVTDVCDGMDFVGLPDVGLMDPEILPLWRDTEHFKHRVVGVAVTARYVPTQRPHFGVRKGEDFDAWVGHFYSTYSPEPFTPLIRKGTVLVFDDAPLGKETGSIGSNNIMSWVLRGCVGVVTDSSARDTDEIIAEKIPLYFRGVGRGIRPGRNEIESVNRPIVCGGVLVMPGDVIVADGDGVIVVPRRQARQVAEYAMKTIESDKAARRALYEKLGLPLDDSVR
ncbi:MAG: RraA family protein [bacterium]|nr:RraA family protein [bacterium]